MNTLERYLLREVGSYLLAGLAVVVLLLLGGILFEVLAPLIARGASLSAVAQYLAFRVPEALVRGLPIAYLFALLLSLSRMAEDSELKVLLSSGISRMRVVWTLVFFGLVLALLGFVTGESWVPIANQQSLQVLRRAVLSKPRMLLQPGTFFTDAAGRRIYVGRVTDGGIGEVRVISAGEVLLAQQGRFKEGRLLLGKGLRITYENARPRSVATFDSGMVPLDELALEPPNVPANLTLAQLVARIKSYRAAGLPYAAEATAYWRKLAEPAASIAFALFGSALAFWLLGGSRSLGMVGVVVLTFLYYATWSVFRIMGEQGVLPAFIAGFGPDILYAAAGLVFLALGRR